eukprot:CAMPEP_0113441690 /NCGR_PEP_ID=MMETSP0014_2-20120614/1214_1 /TAXON_ID=2857 /ORGANISM="Nitzschia sp." /LENGTH=619 /DNA_ID=CAMNT_0000332545 /DNA_START=251 /DNA_END=2110 /DNA_ORIENTATION=+ /assembly_acc=CAM_ASM_000159
MNGDENQESFLIRRRDEQESFLAQQRQFHESFLAQQQQFQESFRAQQKQHQENFQAQQKQHQENFNVQQQQHQERFDTQQRQLQEHFDRQQQQLLNNYHARSNPDPSSATLAAPRLHQQDHLEQHPPSHRLSLPPSNPSQVKPAATTGSVTVESFVLPLFASNETDESPSMIDIVQHEYQENGLNTAVDANNEWWFPSQYKLEGDSFVELRELINQAANEEGFSLCLEKRPKPLTSGEIPFFVRCRRSKSQKCKFRFTIHWCPEQLRFKFRNLNGMCNWTHTCRRTIPHTPIPRPTAGRMIPPSTPQQDNANSQVLSSGIVYCKLDEALLKIHQELKNDLATKVRHVGRGNRRGRESGYHYQKDGDANWPISDHEHHNNQIYSRLAATSTEIVTGSGKKQKVRMYDPTKDEMATLVDKKPGWLLENCSNIDPGNEHSGYTLHPIFQYFDDNNFPGIRAGSYHKAVGDQVNGTKPELSCYRGHCDVCYFDNVIFTVVQFWTWVFIAVPKGKAVPAHSNDDFEEWRHGRKEIHGCRLNEADQEKVNKYYTKFKQEAPGEMNKKYEETIEDVDVYAFLLEPGGYLAFSAHILYHSTLTSYQTSDSFRELLALHGFQWHRTTG